MKLSCKVIEDMLPLYYDGVCSEDSNQLVEEHLKGCERCKAMLVEMGGEVSLAETPMDDLQPLKEIGIKWKKEKKRSAKKGACIALAALLSVFLLWCGVWYFGYAVRYDVLAAKLERASGEFPTTASHALMHGDYAVLLKKPGFLGEGGFVHIGNQFGMTFFVDESGNVIGQDKDMYVDLFFYPEFGGGYRGMVMFEDGHTLWTVYLTPELTYDHEANGENRPKKEIAKKEALLEEYREEVEALVKVAEEIWGIDPLA